MSPWLVLAAVLCGVGAVGARSLLQSALWLAATSALLSILLYTIGAPVVAVVELSVGVGLVAVLFVFVVGIAGEDGVTARSAVPLAIGLVLAVPAIGLLLWLTAGGLAGPASPTAGTDPSVATVLWQDRAADVLGQVVLIVAGALGVVTILGGSSRGGAARASGATTLSTTRFTVVARPAAPAPEIPALERITPPAPPSLPDREPVPAGAGQRPGAANGHAQTPPPPDPLTREEVTR